MKLLVGFLRRALLILLTLAGIVPMMVGSVWGAIVFWVITVIVGVAATGGTGADTAFIILHYELWMYIVGVVFVLFIMTTFTYLNCCVGVHTLRYHLHHDRQGNCENLLIGFLWPFFLPVVNINLKRWGQSWLDAIHDVWEYRFSATRLP